MISAADKLRLKAAARMLFRDYGSLAAAAEVSGVSHSQLGRYQHVDAPDFMPAQLIALLEGQEGVRPHVSQALAAINGNILVPQPRPGGNDVWVGRLGELARDAGTLMTGLGKALADGAISAEEIGHLGLRAKVSELQSVLAEIDGALKHIEHTKPKGKS